MSLLTLMAVVNDGVYDDAPNSDFVPKAIAVANYDDSDKIPISISIPIPTSISIPILIADVISIVRAVAVMIPLPFPFPIRKTIATVVYDGPDAISIGIAIAAVTGDYVIPITKQMANAIAAVTGDDVIPIPISNTDA